jgi:rare lipoprotein A
MMSQFRRLGAALLFILPALALPIKASGWEQTGTASWYGGIFQGKITANGETYDTYGYTCAHRTLPFGTILEVKNLKNGNTVEVRVNDRGPFVDNRIIDLTYAAARDLDMVRDGTAEVILTPAGEGIPETRFNVQIGAWADIENAANHRLRLTDAGFAPRAQLGSDGITRLLIEKVAEEDVFALSQALKELGYTSLFIYQIRES